MAAVFTPVGIMSFPKLFTPETNPQNPGQGPRYSLILLWDAAAVNSPAFIALRQAVMDALVNSPKVGPVKAQDQNFVNSLHFPFRDAKTKTYKGFENGHTFATLWTNAVDQATGAQNRPPEVVDLHGQPLTPQQVWPGQLARAYVSPFYYDNKGNRGVSLGLTHVQIVKQDMPRLDGRMDASAAFAQADNSQLLALGIDPNAPAPAMTHANPGAPATGGVKLPF